jgi:hypothetical protein
MTNVPRSRLQLFDRNPRGIPLRAVMHEDGTIFGTDLRVPAFLLSSALYAEDVGVSAGSVKDTRRLTFTIGW